MRSKPSNMGIGLITAGLFTCLITGCLRSDRAMPSQTATVDDAKHDARMAWWREARFGMFIHWGLYAIPAGQWGDVKTYGEWIRDKAEIPLAEYDKLQTRFNPVHFDADEWVKLAKDAGAKYIVITTKHHDGFCLFDSQYTDFDVMATPFKRDIMKELAQACEKAGIRVCWYHSIMDWHHPDYLPRRPWETAERPAGDADFTRYVAYMKNQLRELLTHYGPIGVLWFDGQWEGTWNNDLGREIEAHVRSLQPDIIINSRVGRAGGPYGIDRSQGGLGDYGTPEQFIPDAAIPNLDWETCMTMNDHWGYNKHDANWKSPEELLRMLIDIASKGGNFLLNVGPTADGVIPQPSVERLHTIGAWLKANGEAIYGTQGGPFKLTADWGRCTQRQLPNGDARLFLHIFDRPVDGRLILTDLLNQPKQAYLLSQGPQTAVQAKQLGSGVEVVVPQPATNEDVFVIVLDLEGPADVGYPPEIVADYPVFTDSLNVTLRSEQHNIQLRYTLDGTEPTAQSAEARGPLSLTQTTTIKARSFRGNRPVSPPTEATFTKVPPRSADKGNALKSGMTCDYYEGAFSTLADIAALGPVASGTASAFSIEPARRDHEWALRFQGFVKAPTTGPYRFSLRSDDGSRLWIGDKLVVNNDGLHSSLELSGVIALEAGLHPIRVEMFELSGGAELTVSWETPGMPKQQIPPEAIFHRP